VPDITAPEAAKHRATHVGLWCTDANKGTLCEPSLGVLRSSLRGSPVGITPLHPGLQGPFNHLALLPEHSKGLLYNLTRLERASGLHRNCKYNAT